MISTHTSVQFINHASFKVNFEELISNGLLFKYRFLAEKSSTFEILSGPFSLSIVKKWELQITLLIQQLNYFRFSVFCQNVARNYTRSLLLIGNKFF